MPLQLGTKLALCQCLIVRPGRLDRKSTRLNSSHGYMSYAVFCFRKKEIGQDEGIARITLTAGGGVAGAAGLEGVGVDGDDGMAGGAQGIDEEARRAFEGDGEDRG